MEEVNGQVAALESAVLALIAAHPKREGLQVVLRTIRETVERKVDMAALPAYAAGWNRTMDMLLAELEVDRDPI